MSRKSGAAANRRAGPFEVSAAAFVGASMGGVIVWFGQAGSFRITPEGMDYADLAAILLTAVGVIVAIFAGVLALAAIWGFNQLKRDAVAAAEVAGSTEIREQIENGTIKDYIAAEVGRLADEEFKSERMDQRIKNRVDAVAFGRPDADRLLEEEGDE
ncbi:hypothetical protein [Sphingopyxis sp. KK2]|uniref:hypothetical protein n=1 Tax=Sphingopyxis sp. KK2 TaxID=1855727 RepID=UPI00097E5778|nr:hypothetical protein [Sphingopyxis sp. KK2]